MIIKPSKKQLEFLEWKFGTFFHFGIRSSFPGHRDWDGLPMPASEFNPKHLDCEQWIRLSAKAGAKYAILVAKHHDGFANWPSNLMFKNYYKHPISNLSRLNTILKKGILISSRKCMMFLLYISRYPCSLTKTEMSLFLLTV